MKARTVEFNVASKGNLQQADGNPPPGS